MQLVYQFNDWSLFDMGTRPGQDRYLMHFEGRSIGSHPSLPGAKRMFHNRDSDEEYKERMRDVSRAIAGD